MLSTRVNNYRVKQMESNLTIYYQSGKYVLCQVHSQFKDIKSNHQILKDKSKSKRCIPEIQLFENLESEGAKTFLFPK